MYKHLKHCFLLFALLLIGCSSTETVSLAGVFPGADAFPAWTPDGQVAVFDRENLYDLVNGQAEAFFVYGFEQVAVQSYENAEGNVLRIEIWELAEPADAYGLFTVNVSGTPADIGNDGDADPGRRLAFWQERYYVHLRARQELDDAKLWELAEAVSAALPSGGAQPALMARLPTDGLVERSAIFFHEEMSIQNEVWLGGENLLGLSHETDGALARYDVGGAVARLLLVQYPNVETAAAGLAALEGSGVGSLATADVRGDLLGAVFGEVDEGVANTLLARALDNK